MSTEDGVLVILFALMISAIAAGNFVGGILIMLVALYIIRRAP